MRTRSQPQPINKQSLMRGEIKFVRSDTKHFGFGEVITTGERFYIPAGIIKEHDMTPEDTGVVADVLLRDSHHPDGERYVAELTFPDDIDEDTAPEPNSPEVIEDQLQFDLAKVEMAVQGINTALSGIEVALSPNQKQKVSVLLQQVETCVLLLADELDISAQE